MLKICESYYASKMNNGLILTELMTKHICHVNMYVFTTVSTSLVKQYSELGLRGPEPIYMRVG